jgi:signal transduction histidine kinase
MKRSWISIISAAVLISLLGVLGVLQYRWLVQASEADAEKMQKRLNSDTKHFADDFDQELQNIYFNFQVDPADWEQENWSEFDKRYEFWRARTAYPELVKNVFFIPADASASSLVFDPGSKMFEQVTLPPEVESLRAKFANDADLRPVYEDVPALLVVIHRGPKPFRKIVIRTRPDTAGPELEAAPKLGFLLILLDRQTLTERILPDLAAKYFPDNEFRVAVKDAQQDPVFATGSGIDGSDSTASLFTLSPDKLVFFATRDLLPAGAPNEKREVVVNRTMQTHTMTVARDAAQQRVHVEMDGNDPPRTASIERNGPSDLGHWTMQVQHRAGSIENFVAGQRRRDLGIGFGLLLLLGTGISLVYISAMKARRYAQRQVDFVSSVSHEFRTPLAVIYSAGENLEDGIATDGSQISKYGRLIKNEGKKLSAMVEQILEFAGAGSGSVRYNFENTNAGELIDNAVSEASAFLKANEINVETRLAVSLPDLKGDAAALSRSIQNLIVNAVKYGGSEKWLRISAENGNSTVKISVEVRGIGISKSDLRHIFEPFFRARSVVDSQIHGNGLGLSVVRQTAVAHGGRAYAVSEPGKGSKFTIELPAAWV